MIHMQTVDLLNTTLLHRIIFNRQRKVEIVFFPFARVTVLQVFGVVGAF